MTRKLIIRLKNTDSPILDLTWTYFQNGGQPQFPKQEEFHHYLSRSDQIVVLIPGEDVLITQVQLPKLTLSQLRKALPYALEDQLVDDPHSLHFAASARNKGRPVPVAIVSKEKMEAWIAFITHELKGAYSKVTAFVPDMLAVPFQEKSYQILANHQLALVRTDLKSGFAIEKENLFSVLDLMFKRPNQPKPELINIRANEPVFSNLEQEKLAVPIELNSAPENPLTLLGPSVLESYPINLLQGHYAQKQKSISIEQLAKLTYVVIAALLILIMIEDIISYVILKRLDYKINVEKQLIYSAVYPNTKIPDDPKRSMQNDLSKLRAIHADSIFIRLIDIADPIVQRLIAQGLILSDANFRNNQLIISIQTKDSTLVESLQQGLEGQGLKVSVKSAQRSSSGLIETHLTIEEIS